MLPAVEAYRCEWADRSAIPGTMPPRINPGFIESYILCDPRVRELIPGYSWISDPRTMPMESNPYVVSINVWDAVAKLGKDLHPTRMFFRYLGLDDPGEVVQPEIVVDDSAPAYDYVIAPFANDPARAMPDELIERLVLKLLAIQHTALIAVVCGHGQHRDSRWWDRLPYHVAAAIGRPLPFVASLMRNARKAVITVDSMANRLAHAAGVENHVLLCSDVVPEVRATHPGARVLYGPPASWSVEKVLSLLPA